MDLSNDDLRRFRSYASELPAALGDQVRAAIDAETAARAASSLCVVCAECNGLGVTAAPASCTLCGGEGWLDRDVAEAMTGRAA